MCLELLGLSDAACAQLETLTATGLWGVNSRETVRLMVLERLRAEVPGQAGC
jgi:hypothetical protein